MLSAVAFTTSSASAESSPAVSDSEPQALCDYRVWATDGVNEHRSRDRLSPIVRHRPHGYVYSGVLCENKEGGAYGSCGTGPIWKSVGGPWVPSKCLVRLD
jgi:hypothetical protein